MTGKISQLPWRVEDSSDGPMIESGAYSVASCRAWHPCNIATQAANAAFIVRACNSHEKMKGAIKYLLECSAPMTRQQDECWKSLRAALAAAEAQ